MKQQEINQTNENKNPEDLAHHLSKDLVLEASTAESPITAPSESAKNPEISAHVENTEKVDTGDIGAYEAERDKREEEEAKKVYMKHKKEQEELKQSILIKDTATGKVHDSKTVMSQVTKLTKLNEEIAEQPWELWWAIKKERNSQLLQACEIGDVEKIRELLRSRKLGELVADINTRGLDDFTPLHIAVSEVHIDCVEVLLMKGADVNAISTSKRTPLHIACYRGNKKIIELLVQKGANINAQEKEGNTPAHILAEQGSLDALSWLLTQKPDLTIKNSFGETAPEVSANIEIRNLFGQNTSVSKPDSTGYSRTVLDNNVILHNNRADMIKFLMFKGQMLSSQGPESDPNANPAKPKAPEEKKGETPAQNVPAKENKRRLVKIIEAAHEIAKKAGPTPAVKTHDEKIGPEYFELIQLLGKGSFGEVYLVKYKVTGKLYAMKVLNKKRVMSQNLLKYAMTERNVLCFTKHPFIVGLDFAFQTPERLFLILEFCPAGDLGRKIQKEKKFSEDLARIYAAEVLLALEDLHKRDIVFRDLKPENIVLDADGHAMLTDFGLSKEGVQDNVSAKSFCGSIAYLAPEILKRSGHGKSIDWYLLGLLIYEMLVGIPPYYSSNRDQLFINIQNAPLKLPFTLSAEAKSLIVGLLNRNPTKRLGSGPNDAADIKRHPWFKSIDWDLAMKRGLEPPKPPERVIPTTRLSVDLFVDVGEEDPDRIENWTILDNTKK